jgi:hypothetical protein
MLIAVALTYAMRRSKASEALQFFTLFALMISAIPLASEWFHVALVPQPDRYHLEMDLAVSLALVFAARPLVQRLSWRYQALIGIVLVVLFYYPARQDRRYARKLVKPTDISQTIEYKLAAWFDAHMKGQRVMAPGTVSYWLNTFTDTPQFGGGFDQGIVNPNHAGIQYQIYSADSAGDRAPQVDSAWFRAFGVQAVAVADPKSHEQPFRRPEIFPQAFPEATRDGDSGIYWVPGNNPSLAHVVGKNSLVRDPPYNGLDIAQTQAFVDALTTPASFRWTSRHSAQIEATLAPDQLIYVQVTYHPGWHALVNGRSRRIFGDGLDQLVIAPECNGHCRVDLTYDGGTEMRVAKTLSWSSAIGCMLWIILARRKAR